MMYLYGQCNVLYNFESRFRGRCSISEICFRNINPLRRSCVVMAQNAGKVVFSDIYHSAEVVPTGS